MSEHRHRSSEMREHQHAYLRAICTTSVLIDKPVALAYNVTLMKQTYYWLLMVNSFLNEGFVNVETHIFILKRRVAS